MNNSYTVSTLMLFCRFKKKKSVDTFLKIIQWLSGFIFKRTVFRHEEQQNVGY